VPRIRIAEITVDPTDRARWASREEEALVGKGYWVRIAVVAALGACVLGVLVVLTLFDVSAWVQFAVLIVFMALLAVGAYGFAFGSRGGDGGEARGRDRT